MNEDLFPLLLTVGRGRSGAGSLLPLLLLSGLERTFTTGEACSDSSSSSSTSERRCGRPRRLAPTLHEQLQRIEGCRAKFTLQESTLWPGGEVIIARIVEVETDYVYIDRIEVNGVPSLDPEFLFLAISDIIGVQPIPRSRLLLESIFRLQ